MAGRILDSRYSRRYTVLIKEITQQRYILEIFMLKPGQTGPTSMRVDESRQSRIVREHFMLHTERIKEYVF